MPTDDIPEGVALESDVPEFTRAIVNRRLVAMGSSVRIGSDIELSRDTLDYAAREVANELWRIIVHAMREAHPNSTFTSLAGRYGRRTAAHIKLAACAADPTLGALALADIGAFK